MGKTVGIIGASPCRSRLGEPHSAPIRDRTPPLTLISGAGPSGLVAAKCFLRDAPAGAFRVTIFETQSRVGGLWPVRNDEVGGLVHPLMVANQSRHTVQFSDLAWDPKTPQMPRAWQVGQYLERYRDRYCREASIHLGSRVEKATPVSTAAAADGTLGNTWHLEVLSSNGEIQEHQFDHLVVASGVFGRPAIPALRVNEPQIPEIHSSNYRDLKSLLAGGRGRGHKILVVGGQMSGVEIAGTIASHLSSATHSPSKSDIPDIGGYSIHHVLQHPVWVLPLYVTPKVCLFLAAIRPIPPHADSASHSHLLQHRLSYPWTSLPTTSTTGHHP